MDEEVSLNRTEMPATAAALGMGDTPMGEAAEPQAGLAPAFGDGSCVADAAAYLRERAASWSVPALRERLLLVGESWGRPALPMLSKLAAEPGATAALGWLREGASR